MWKFAKVVVAAAFGLFVAGCAVPPAVTIASFVADGASFVSSGKTMADHGISAIFDEDCALIRIFDGEVCRDTPEYETAVAVLQPHGVDRSHPGLATGAPMPTDVASAAPVEPVMVEAIGLDATRPSQPVVTVEPVVVERSPMPAPKRKPESFAVASDAVGPPLKIGPDPLHDLEFQRDVTLPEGPMHISLRPVGPRLTDRASAALAGLQARAAAISFDG